MADKPKLKLYRKLEVVKLDTIRPNSWNPNIVSPSMMDTLINNIEEEGFIDPIIITKDNVIVNGEHRWKALKKLGQESATVIRLDINSRSPRAKVQTLRLNAIHGEWDKTKLEPVLEGLKGDGLDLTTLGLDTGTIRPFLEQKDAPEDIIPPKPKKPVTRKGQLILMGEHRLLCGDARSKEDVDTLFDDDRANMVVTSPPYFNQREYSQWKTYDDYMADMNTVAERIKSILKPSNVVAWNIGHDEIGHRDLAADHSIMLQRHFMFRDAIAWVKGGAVFCGRSLHTNKTQRYFPAFAWEHVLIFSSKTMPKFDAADTEYLSGHYRNVWEIHQVVGSEQKALGHTAMFPLELATRAIRAYSQRGALVYDPFGGSGTTLISAEQHERRCYMMEIDTGYCDVIVKRWETLTGQKAKRTTT